MAPRLPFALAALITLIASIAFPMYAGKPGAPFRYSVSVGTGWPLTYYGAADIMFSPDGAIAGLIVQGPHRRNSLDQDFTIPGITTYALSIGWAYPDRASVLRGSGAKFFMGTGNAGTVGITYFYHFGWIGRIVAEAYEEPGFAIGIYAEGKYAHAVRMSGQRGYKWKTEREDLWNLSAGLALQF